MLDQNIIAYNLRNMYKEKQRQLVHPKFKLHKRYQNESVWIKAANMCIEMQMQPGDFIEALFEYAKNPKTLYPTHMAGASARSACENWKKRQQGAGDVIKDIQEDTGAEVTASDSYELDLKLEIFYALQRLKNNTGSAEINEQNLRLIRASYITMPAYIRILLAPHDEEVANRFQDKANYLVRSSPGLYDALRRIGAEPDKLFSPIKRRKKHGQFG